MDRIKGSDLIDDFLHIKNLAEENNDLLDLMEMANFDASDFLVELEKPVIFHLFQPGKNKFSHGPRIKFILKGGNEQFELGFDSKESDGIKVIGKPFLSDSEVNLLKLVILYYRHPITVFWDDPQMTARDFDKLLRIHRNKNPMPEKLKKYKI